MTTPVDADNPNTGETRTTLSHKKQLISFPAANDDYCYLCKCAAILRAAFSAQPLDVSLEDRARARDEVEFSETSDGGNATTAPMIKGLIHVDYRTNLHIHASCFINRDCYIADSPDCEVSSRGDTLVGVRSRILRVSHLIHWRERQGRHVPSLAGDVKIGNDCFIEAGATVLPGVSVGNGCVGGEGPIVTRCVPACHVLAGNPARVLRKVTPIVPDAPSLVCESEAISVVDCGTVPTHKLDEEEVEHSSSGGSSEIAQPWQSLLATRTKIPVSLGRPHHAAVDVCALIMAVGVEYWLGESTSA